MYSIIQAELGPDLGGGVRPAALFDTGLCQILLFELFEIFFNKLARIKVFGSPGLLGEAGQPFFDGGFQSDAEHISSYICHAPMKE
jgi:hypothetical protein